MKAIVSAVFAAAALGVLGAPTSMHTTRPDNCTSVQAPAGGSLLTGGKVHIHIVHDLNMTDTHNHYDEAVKFNETGSKHHDRRRHLSWNATFTDPTYTQGFTGVFLTEKVEKEPKSVTEWSIQSAGSGLWQFS